MKAELELEYDEDTLMFVRISLTGDQISTNFMFEIPKHSTEDFVSLLELISCMESGKEFYWLLCRNDGDTFVRTDGTKTHFNVSQYGARIGSKSIISVDNSIVLPVFKELRQIIQKS